MSLLTKIPRKLEKYGIPNLTVWIIAGQSLMYVAAMTGNVSPRMLFLDSSLVMAGEWWRLLTFILVPPATNPLFAFFGWYMFYLMGGALESEWGELRYNTFVFAGIAFTVAASFVLPGYPFGNSFIGGSVFLAFATLYPHFVIQIFFILPVEVRWLALVTWLIYGWQFLFGHWHTRLMIVASVANYLLFFGRDIVGRMRQGRRGMAWQAKKIASRKDDFFHTCTVCGITDKTHPKTDFRYCPQCEGQFGYCPEHIFRHDHIKRQ